MVVDEELLRILRAFLRNHEGYAFQILRFDSRAYLYTGTHFIIQNAVAALKVKDLSIGDLSSKKTERIVKLRNPWAKSKEEGWKGRAGNEDREFWDGV